MKEYIIIFLLAAVVGTNIAIMWHLKSECRDYMAIGKEYVMQLELRKKAAMDLKKQMDLQDRYNEKHY